MTMFRRLALAGVAATLSLVSLPAAAATIASTPGTRGATLGGTASGNFGGTAGQSFTALDNTLTSIGFQFSRPSATSGTDANYTLSILSGEGLSGSSLFSTTFAVAVTSRAFSFVDILLPNLAVTVGSKYTAVLNGTNSRYVLGLGPDYNLQTGVALSGDSYAGGRAFLTTTSYANCTNDSSSNCDLNFRVVGTTVVAVPEPATWATMFLGLSLGGVALRRRARRSVRIAA
jgi:hypothetical protein